MPFGPPTWSDLAGIDVPIPTLQELPLVRTRRKLTPLVPSTTSGALSPGRARRYAVTPEKPGAFRFNTPVGVVCVPMFNVPSTYSVPTTCSLLVGLVVPMPTLPVPY